MPSTYRDAISRVRSFNKMISIDNSISDRAILSEIRSSSSLYIKRETNLRRLWNSPNLFTYVKCLKMIPVPLAECCDYKSPCTIMRSACKLPKIGEGIHSLLMKPVTSIDGSIIFQEGTASRYANILKIGLPKKPLLFWIQNNYLYISSKTIEYVSLTAYFPDGLEEFLEDDCMCDPHPDEDPCQNPLDSLWKIPPYLEENVISTVNQKLANTYFRHTTDPQSDITKDDQR